MNLPNEDKVAILTINPIEVDTSNIVFEGIEKVYDGTMIELLATGSLPNEVLNIRYENNIQKEYCAEPYEARAIFVMKSEYVGNYVAKPSVLTAQIKILQV